MAGASELVPSVRVPDAEGDLDGLGVDEGRAAGQRDSADPRGGGREAGKVPRRHEACVLVFSLQSRLCISSSWAPAVTTSMLVEIHAF